MSEEPKKLDSIIVTPMTHIEMMDYNKVRTSFLKMLELYKDKEVIAAEIGVFEGVNAKYMCMFCDKIKLFLVDGWDNVTIYTGGPVQNIDYCRILRSVTQINLFAYQDKVFFMDKDSAEAVKEFEDEFFDYVYIDGDHLYESVKTDLNLWLPKVKKGGIFGGHDVIMPDISRALDELIKEHNITDDRWGKDSEEKAEKEGRSDFWVYK